MQDGRMETQESPTVTLLSRLASLGYGDSEPYGHSVVQAGKLGIWKLRALRSLCCPGWQAWDMETQSPTVTLLSRLARLGYGDSEPYGHSVAQAGKLGGKEWRIAAQVSLPTQYNGKNQSPVGALSGTLARLHKYRKRD